MIIPIHTEGVRRKYINYRVICLFSYLGKVNVKCLDKRYYKYEILEQKLDDTQCTYRPAVWLFTTGQIFALQQKFEKTLEYAKDVYTCFVDLKKAKDPVLCEHFWEVLRTYGVNDCLLLAVISLYSCSEVCVRVGELNSEPYTVSVGLRQRLVVECPRHDRRGKPSCISLQETQR